MKKTKIIIIIIGLILLTSGGFIALDLVTHSLSIIFKGFIVFLSTILVFLINNDGLDKSDTKLLKLSFILIIFADLSLLFFNEPYMGISIFFLVQCMLIYRNCRYIYGIYSYKEILDKYNIVIILTLITLLIIYLLISRNFLENKILFIFFTLYGLIKSGSVFAAITNYRLKLFPKINSKLLLIGVICFYLCDICVGFTLTFKTGFISGLSSVLIWIFYTPALTLIGLSGYDFSDL